jgi:hypothetical protein
MSYLQLPDHLKSCLLLTAQSGYLRKEFYFKYLSPKSRSSKFRNWKLILDSGYFISYQRKFIGEDVFKLSNKGKKLLTHSGQDYVSACHPLHFEHDDVAIEFALANQAIGNISNDWHLEKELRKNQTFSFKHAKGSSEKMPDLIFKIPVGMHSLTCALEVERTRKSFERYHSFINAYKTNQQIDMVLVAYSSESIKTNLQKSVNLLAYPTEIRPILFCKLSELIADPVGFCISISGVTISFSKYLSNIQTLHQAITIEKQDYESEEGSR